MKAEWTLEMVENVSKFHSINLKTMYVYIGIYIEVPLKKVQVPKKRFLNPTTKLEMRSPFHPQTGEKAIVEEYFEMEDRSPNCYDLEALGIEGLENDIFFSPEYHVNEKICSMLLFNRRTKYSIPVEQEIPACVEITTINATQLIEEFKVEYKAYLDYFERDFGIPKVSYGVISYSY